MTAWPHDNQCKWDRDIEVQSWVSSFFVGNICKHTLYTIVEFSTLFWRVSLPPRYIDIPSCWDAVSRVRRNNTVQSHTGVTGHLLLGACLQIYIRYMHQRVVLGPIKFWYDCWHWRHVQIVPSCVDTFNYAVHTVASVPAAHVSTCPPFQCKH